MALPSDGILNLRVCDHAHNLHLVGDRPEYTQDVSVTLHKTKFSVLQALFLCKLLDDQTSLAQVVTGQAREEMVGNLEVETTVDELDRWRTDNVDRRPQLTSEERLCDSQVLCGAREMRQHDLSKPVTLEHR